MHPPKDDRIYYKQVLSLVERYPAITLIAPLENGAPAEFHPSVRFIPLPKASGIIGRLRSILTAAVMVRRMNPDVCHFHDFDLILAVPLIRMFKKIRVVYDSHEAYPEMFKRSPRLPRFLRNPGARIVNAVEKGLARWCTLVVTADEATAESFRRNGIFATAVYNFPPLGLFTPDPETEEILKRRYSGRSLLIYQGTMGRDRGLFHMLRAMAIVHRQDTSILLLLVGLDDPVLHREALDRIRSLGIENAVEILPWVDHEDIGSYMRICDIGLIPLQPREKYMMNIPIKLFEYMACELPILSANLPPIVRFLSPSGAGRLYDSTDDRALAEGVLDMLADPDGLRRMGKKGLDSVKVSWNWSQMELKLLDIYRYIETAGEKGAIASARRGRLGQWFPAQHPAVGSSCPPGGRRQ